MAHSRCLLAIAAVLCSIALLSDKAAAELQEERYDRRSLQGRRTLPDPFRLARSLLQKIPFSLGTSAPSKAVPSNNNNIALPAQQVMLPGMVPVPVAASPPPPTRSPPSPHVGPPPPSPPTSPPAVPTSPPPTPSPKVRPLPPPTLASPPPHTKFPPPIATKAPDADTDTAAMPGGLAGNIDCKQVNSVAVIDGDMFPYGRVYNSECSCNNMPYDLVFGNDVLYKGTWFYSFTLVKKPCTGFMIKTIDDGNINTCDKIRGDLNKIAFRIENQYAYCFGLTTPTRITAAARNTFKQAFYFRGDTTEGSTIREWSTQPDAPAAATMAAQPWLANMKPLNNGAGFTTRAFEFFLYNLRGDDTGTFLMAKCGDRNYIDLCKGGKQGRCVHGFINTPEHGFSAICKTLGLGV